MELKCLEEQAEGICIFCSLPTGSEAVVCPWCEEKQKDGED